VCLHANKGHISIIEDENYVLDLRDALLDAPLAPNSVGAILLCKEQSLLLNEARQLRIEKRP
jgi:hypothetical protein